MANVSSKFKIEYVFDDEETRRRLIFPKIEDFYADVNAFVDDELLMSYNIFIFELACQLTIWLNNSDENFSYESFDDDGEGLVFTQKDNNLWEIKSDWTELWAERTDCDTDTSKSFLVEKQALVNGVKSFTEKIREEAKQKYRLDYHRFLKFYH